MIVRLIRSGPMALWMLAGFLVLSALDAGLTLYLMEHGAKEANPLMAAVIEHGPAWFWSVKMSLALLCVVILEAAYLCSRRSGFRVITAVYFFQVAVVIWNLNLVRMV